MKELVKGQESATQLKVLLEKPFGSEGSLSCQELTANVLRSFTQAISIINSSSADEVAHRSLLNSGQNGSPVAVSGENRSQKGRRGRYNRRKNALTWTILSCTTDDNHAWRKYGQKRILNSEFPRSYFRCSHKYDQGCRAIKQVQVDQENPNMLQTTYIGIHTCNGTPMATHSAIGSSSTEWESSYLLNFDHHDSKVPNVQDHHISSPNLTIKQEFPKEDTHSDVADHKYSDPNLWSDLKDFQPFKPTIMPFRMESDNNNNNNTNADNVYSSCTDYQRLNMNFEMASVHFDTDFHFDESHFDESPLL
ncbi:hypothetical protein JHK87_040491 [Glycine soja]|nr:hypothetical protein JHK87_040491 [Glycine soja]